MNKTIRKIIRVALLVLALLNITLAAFGLSPVELDSETLTNLINCGAAVVMALWSCWKNCSVTKPHLEADKVAEAIKQGAEVILQYQAGGERGLSEAEHEENDPRDLEVIEID